MLVLTRKKGERIIVGDGLDSVEITVVEIINGKKVRIGIRAHEDIPVHREEVRLQMLRHRNQVRSLAKGRNADGT